MTDRDDERPNVIPIGGFYLPAPPDWRLSDEAQGLRLMAQGVLSPEDLTLRGRPRCFATNRQGVRCGNEARPGTTVCKFHGGSAGAHPDDPGRNSQNRVERIEKVRLYLELVAQTAVSAVEAVLEDEDAKPSDRLKAAEIVLDRTVGRTLQLEKDDLAERDLDEEILAIADSLAPTGTDGE